MKLPLMAAFAALALAGCAHQSSRAGDARAGANETGGSGMRAESPTAGPGASDEQVWDATEQPRTRDMQKRHGLDFHEGTSGDEGTGGAGAQGNVNNDDCEPGGTGGAGAAGTVGEGSSDKTLVSPRNLGAKFDIAPDAWKENKGIGFSPAAPSTGTPPVEGSGGSGAGAGGGAGGGQ